MSFLTELGYFLVTLWGNVWRWALRKRRNLAISAGVLVLALIVVGTVMQAAGPAPSSRPAAEPTPTPTETWIEATGTPIAAPTPMPTETADPAEAIARQWATDYLSRPSAEDTTWRTKVEAYTIPTVVAQLDAQAFRAEGILYGKAPTSVTEITIGPAPADGETSTPVRWSRTVTATVLGNDGSTTKIAFAVVVMEASDGWTVTAVEELTVEG